MKWRGRLGNERSGKGSQAWCGRHGPVRSERPSREGVAGMASRVLARSGLDGHGRHGFVGTASPGQFWQARRGNERMGREWQARRGQAWKVRHGWLGVVGLGQCTAGKASVGTASLGMAGEVTRAWLGLEWRALQASLGAEGQARLAGVERVVWNGGVGRHGVTRPGAIEEPQGLAGMVRKAGIGRQGKAWPDRRGWQGRPGAIRAGEASKAWLARRDLA